MRSLHDLDIQDKHVTILGVDSNRAIGVQMDWEPKLRAGLDPILSAIIDPERIIFVFSDGPLDNAPAVETLKELVKVVEGVLAAFTALVAARA